MRSDIAACPYCNAELPPLAAPATGRYAACPRCGEPVPAERFPATSAAPAPAPAPPLPQRKRQTAKVLLAIMVGMATLALVFALMTQKWRREHDFRYKADPAAPVVAEPARMLGLGYLPNGCNIAVAVQLAALEQDDAGRALLREPRSMPLEQMLKPLASMGLTIADVEQVVVGSELKELQFRVTTVIVTRKPYDPAQVQQAAARRPVKSGTFRNRPLLRFTDERDIPKLWLADARVLVYTTLTAEELERIPTSVKEPAETLTAAARDALKARLDRQSRIWAVGDLAPAKELIDALQLFAGPMKDQLRLLTLVRAFDIGITTVEGQSLTVRGDFYTGNPAATQELAKYLSGVTIDGAKSQKVETPPADLPAAEAQWVSWQLRADADALREAVGRVSLTPPKQGAR
jgi:hypothetical protein